MSRLLLYSGKVLQITNKLANVNKIVLFPLNTGYSTVSLSLNRKNSSTEIVKETNKSKQKNELNELERELKFKKDLYEFNQNIKAYVDVCCKSNKLLSNALSLIEDLTRVVEHDRFEKIETPEEQALPEVVNDSPPIEDEIKQPRRIKYINDVEIYNKLMFALAKNGNTHKIVRLFTKMRSKNGAGEPIQPNLNSYVAALQSIGYNLNNKPELDINTTRLNVERILFDIKKANLLVEDIATSLNYSNEQQNDIKKALKLVIPEFEFKDIDDKTKSNPLICKLKEKSGIENFTTDLTGLPKTLYKKELMMKNFETQIEKEKQLMITVPSILKEDNNKKSIKTEKEREDVLRHFRDAITKSFITNIEILKNSSKRSDVFIYPFLSVMDKSTYIDLLVQEICILAQSSNYFSNSISVLAINLASRLEKRFHEFCMRNENELDKIKKIYEKYIDYKIDVLTQPNQNNQREEWLKLMRQENLFLSSEDTSWPYYIKVNVGKFLLENILLKSCFIPSNIAHRHNISKNVPKAEKAFYKIYRITGVYKDPQLKIHPYLINLFSDTLMFESYRMPMITPPLPWYTPIKGGYFLSKSNLLRLSSNLNEQRILIEKTDPSNMYPIYDSLNTLSACAWKINKPVLDLIIQVFNNKGNKDLEVPQPSSEAPQIAKLKEKVSKEEFRTYLREKTKAEKVRAEMHSLWCTELYRLSIANMFRDTVIWFPHSLDFRGRSYPIPPHFNHLGSDIARSLIMFAEGKKLGKHGLDTLKIHLINLTGTMKKATIAERLEFANSIIDDIIDSAEKPFDGKLWWQQSEEKWQTLACCIEIADAIKSGNSEEFISHYPIHQDGSCNGLQHYAALGRDQEGAQSVNLAPSERPQDVYSTVLDLVEKFRESEEQTNPIASILKGHVKRKVIKQTVMTTVYNVTFYGAKLQILRQLEYLKEFPQEKSTEAAVYLAEKTFQSIRQLFTAAREIQDWFTSCALLISKKRNTTVKWETPLGLPVSQPYYKYTKSIVNIEKPDARKQRNAFPPNFVHSLDSCHMMLTSLYCEKAGITFVSVHDCFWTHASTVDIMNRICREQFVALHSLPLLENLSEYFLRNFQFTKEEIDKALDNETRSSMIEFNRVLANVPKKGVFDLNNVLNSIYFFS